MIFVPNYDESEKIRQIHKYRSEDYALLRMTYTMIDKNNLDANGILRDLLSAYGIADYDLIGHGGENGVKHGALFVQRGKAESVRLKFYRVANARGDRRFSIQSLKKRMRAGEINVGDLLYFSVFQNQAGERQVYFINLTRNTPSQQELFGAIGIDATAGLFLSLKPKLREIIEGGYYDNSKGLGPMAPKDVGDTLESLLGIKANNRSGADCGGLIEVKSKGESKTLDTLFTLRPRFEGTEVSYYEPKDKKRVSAFTRLYGYESDAHPGCQSLYITIGSSEAPQNNQGFCLLVDEEDSKVKIIRQNPDTGRHEVVGFWEFDDLRERLYEKHPSTLWVKAESRVADGMVQFKYKEIEFSRSPQFSTFLSLIVSGDITYGWRGYTTKEGKYSGKNHGNAWRIKPDARAQLFGELEKVEY